MVRKKKQTEGISFPIGESLLGLPYPVFYDPHFAIGENKAPVSLVTGTPGSGKTFFGLWCATQASIANKTVFILDPKVDFKNLKTVSDRGLCGPVQIWELLNESKEVDISNYGVLDPMIMSDNISENVVMTMDVIRQLIEGELSNKQKTALTPIVQDIANDKKTASFNLVIDTLLRNRDDDIRGLGFELRAILDLEMSKLLIRPKGTTPKRMNISRGTTVATLLGIKLPEPGVLPSSYKADERVSVVIMWLLTNLVLQMMKSVPKIKQKMLIIDEAWAIMANEQGSRMMESVSLLGRSLNMASLFITQSPNHLRRGESSPDLDNSISTRFAFRNTSDSDNRETVRSMRLPPEENWEVVIPQLEVGRCLMQDSRDNLGIVKIVAPDDLAEAFNTNPTETTDV